MQASLSPSERLIAVCSALVFATLGTGCIHGGRLSSNSLEGKHILAAYRTEGLPNAKAEYYLVETDKGLALFERVPGSIGSLIKNHWREGNDDHFAIWGEVLDTRFAASEFVLPVDRTKKGTVFIYPEGSYSVLKIDGRYRPATAVPNPAPAYWLVPK